MSIILEIWDGMMDKMMNRHKGKSDRQGSHGTDHTFPGFLVVCILVLSIGIMIFQIIALTIPSYISSHAKNNIKQDDYQDIYHYDVILNNDSIVMELYLQTEDHPDGYQNDTILVISDPYSNSNEYIDYFEIIPEKGLPDGKQQIINWNNSLRKDDIANKRIRYVIHDRIFWSIRNHYAIISKSRFISEADFLFLREPGKNSIYAIDFYENMSENVSENLSDKESGKTRPTKMFNSIYGIRHSFNITQEMLSESFFMSVSMQEDDEYKAGICMKRFGNKTISIVFGNDYQEKDRLCREIFQITGRYFDIFGTPVNMLGNYSIIITDASSFSSRDSGFFVNKESISYIIHEMSHSWQPKKNNCKYAFFMSEGSNNYFLWKTQKDLGIITGADLEYRYRRFNLTSKDYQDYIRMVSDTDTIEKLRKDNPEEFNRLAYYFTAYAWKLAEDYVSEEGYNTAEELKRYFQSEDKQDCSRLDAIFAYAAEKMN